MSFRLTYFNKDKKIDFINSSIDIFFSESGHVFACLAIKSDKLNLLTSIRTGGQIVTAGNGIELIVASLSSKLAIMGISARIFHNPAIKYMHIEKDDVTITNHQTLSNTF